MSSLETSVTLEDVFTVVEAKRVPLAPELAGYLTLEIADGTDAGSGDVDPKTVFISEEGTVALVRPKRDQPTGSAEASVRRLLAKLLEASGSGTPALTAAAKRKPGNGLPALVEELEAALIPVNRSAGRRALARLAREVRRVLLGVGRNASVPPVLKDHAQKGVPHPRPALRKKEADDDAPPRGAGAFVEEEAATVKRQNELAALASRTGETHREKSAPNDEEAIPEPNAAAVPPARPSSPSPSSIPPPPVGSSSPLAPPPPKREPPPPPAAAKPKVEPPPPAFFGPDDVDSLLASFEVSAAHEDKQMARELKAIAGLSPTPPPPDGKTLAELTKDVGKDLPKKLEPSAQRDSIADGDGVEALLALADASGPPPATSTKSNEPPPVATAIPAAHLPPSPIFGPPASPSTSANVPGAPAALRQSKDAPSAPRPESSRDLAKPEPTKSRPTSDGSIRSERRSKPDATGPLPAAPGWGNKRASTDRRPRAPRTAMAMLILALVVLAAGTGVVWKYAPQIFTGKTKSLPTATTARPAPPAPKCKVALVLTDVPTGAEILLRMGQAPVDVERMPVGTRLELVATAEGYTPRRAVIQADSTWDKGPDGKPRIEVPIQLDPSKAKPGTVDPWPAAEPGSQVGGSGPPGTIHVVSNVRGAEIWLVAGLGPEARIDQLRCDSDIDVLFAGPPGLRERLHVGEAEIAAVAPDAQGNKIITVSASK
jgi:hypothetical protein